MPAKLPTLDEMRAILRPRMPRAEFFKALDDLVERLGGLRLGGTPEVVSIPVAEGGTLLCFVKEQLFYVEYEGGTFIDIAEDDSSS